MFFDYNDYYLCSQEGIFKYALLNQYHSQFYDLLYTRISMTFLICLFNYNFYFMNYFNNLFFSKKKRSTFPNLFMIFPSCY